MAPIPSAVEFYRDKDDQEMRRGLMSDQDDLEMNAVDEGEIYADAREDAGMDDDDDDDHDDSSLLRHDPAEPMPSELMTYFKRPYDAWRVRMHVLLLVVSLTLLLFVTGTIRWPCKLPTKEVGHHCLAKFVHL